MRLERCCLSLRSLLWIIALKGWLVTRIPPDCRAVTYIRMSTERQIYSPDHQRAKLQEHARDLGLTIVAEYLDGGRSGLSIKSRPALSKLLSDALRGDAGFATILVYDVSRWGRFQDVDESAYYEYVCRQAGVRIIYCEEPFAHDTSPLGALLKGIKRTMAAEYSRELSDKVFSAQCRFTSLGFKQGGSAGFGLRRMTVSALGVPGRVLVQGERKSVPTDRVVFITGPNAEALIVRRIYSMYIDELLSDTAIATRLNVEGVRSEQGAPWSNYNIKNILTNEKYCGTLVFNRSTQRLRTSRRPNKPESWLKTLNVFDAIVQPKRFEEAQTERARRRRHWSDDEMLHGLREIFVESGHVTADLINARDLPSASSYAHRFNGLVAAFEAAGVSNLSLSRATITRYRLRCITKDLCQEFERCAALADALAERVTPRTYRVKNVLVRIICTRCRYERSHPCWKVTLRYLTEVDFVLWVRMDELNELPAQIYLIPLASFPDHRFVWPSTRTLPTYERFTHASLRHLFGLI